MNKFAAKDSEKMFASLIKEKADFFWESEETIMTSSCPPKKKIWSRVVGPPGARLILRG